MAVTLTLSPSLTSSEQSAIRQTVVCWSVATGGTNPQDMFPGREGKGVGVGGAGSLSVGCHGTQLLYVLTQHFHLSFTYSIKVGE